MPPGTLLVPPRITALDGPGSEGFGQRLSYTSTLVRNGVSTPITKAGGGAFFAVPANVGPRTMNYPALFAQGTYDTSVADVKVFAGTTDDPFWIDLGCAFDTFNTSVSPVLSPAQDAGLTNVASAPFRDTRSIRSRSNCRSRF